MLDISDLDKLESLEPIIPLHEDILNSYKSGINYVCNKLLDTNNLKRLDCYSIIEDYTDNYSTLSEGISILDMLMIYKSCKSLLEDKETPLDETEYTDENFEYNGFIKSEFVIHEHDSKRAPLHWDLRWKTEFKTSAFSFVLLKHKLPDNGEKLLVKQQPMHPVAWVDMVETVIGSGYGQGSVKTIDRGTIFYKKKDSSYAIYLRGTKFVDAYYMINLNNSNFLIFKANKSILADTDERNQEWITYAKDFITYINKTLHNRFNVSNNFIDNSKIEISEDYDTSYNLLNRYNKANTIIIPSIRFCIDRRKDKNFTNFISKECKINNIEDVMRLYLLRNLIAPLFFDYLNIDAFEVFDSIRDIPYTDGDLENMKNTNYTDYQTQKVYRMFADIYLGHKYYGQFDFERFLINLINHKH